MGNQKPRREIPPVERHVDVIRKHFGCFGFLYNAPARWFEADENSEEEFEMAGRGRGPERWTLACGRTRRFFVLRTARGQPRNIVCFEGLGVPEGEEGGSLAPGVVGRREGGREARGNVDRQRNAIDGPPGENVSDGGRDAGLGGVGSGVEKEGREDSALLRCASSLETSEGMSCYFNSFFSVVFSLSRPLKLPPVPFRFVRVDLETVSAGGCVQGVAALAVYRPILRTAAVG